MRKQQTPKHLEQYANKDTWPKDLPAAKEYARQAVNEFQWKDKVPELLAEIDKATRIARLQEIVIYPLLSGEGNFVIKSHYRR